MKADPASDFGGVRRYAARKFFFFLDHHRIRRIKIKELLLSDVMSEFNELMQEDDLPSEVENTNWFALPFVSKVHGDWIALDTDKNSLLSQAEFSRYGGGCFTRPFVERLFQACPTYDRQIDYKVYLDLVLAKTNRQRPESIRFFARLIDLEDDGTISRSNISHFWRGVIEHPVMKQYDPPKTSDIINEVFDMVNPYRTDCISITELVKSGVGHTVCGMLTDVDAFFAYDNRESQDPLATGP